MPYCLRGQQLTGQGTTQAAFFYFSGNTRPIVNYTSNQADIAYWRMTYYVIGFNIGDIYGPVMASYVITAVSGPGECNSPDIILRYDCINGACVSSSTFSTAGIYSTLKACQDNCGGNICPPGMVCLPVGKISKIEGLAIALNNSACS
jgi:hypothetical protein